MTVSASTLLPLIVLLPLLGAAANGFLGALLPRPVVKAIGVGSVAVAFLLAVRAVMALSQIAETDPYDPQIQSTVYTWAVTGLFHFDVAFYLDPLSSVMVLVVTGVGLLIHIYSMGYMNEDPGIARYFSYLNLFMFSMLMLVLGKNLLMLFVGWEGVGLCSYLLIGFWFTDDAKAQAGQKAFVVNRIGDFGFIIGLILILFYAQGTTDYEILEWQFEKGAYGPFYDPVTLTVACLLLFLGACGKSAQIPLYVWLPDAMAGPTPVSALIHAATMVTAGVYMIARLGFMFTLSPVAMGVVATVGALTALAAAFMALTQRDIKKVLAYSTVSQLGYMVLAVGIGAFVAGIFHLMTHAFFKALLFLGAGSVIHGLSGEQDIFKMGGLKRKMPVTRWTFLIACLAIAGVPLLSGFYSKDMILWETYSREQLIPVPEDASASWSDGETALFGGRHGIVLEGTGGTWEAAQMPRATTPGSMPRAIYPTIRAVTQDPDGNVWAVGDHATIYRGEPGTFGRSWTVWQPASNERIHKLLAVWAGAADDVWAVGEGGRLIHFDGTEYVIEKWASPVTFHAVAGHRGHVYVAGGGGVVARRDAALKGPWQPMRSTGSAPITALGAVRETLYGTTGRGDVIKLNGDTWEKVKLEVAGIPRLRDLVALASSDGKELHVAGAGYVQGDEEPRPMIFTQAQEGGAWAVHVGEPGPPVRGLFAAFGSVYGVGAAGDLLEAANGTLRATSRLPHKPWYHGLLFLLGAFAAVLTAFYMFRLYFLTFEGETRCDAHTWGHAHESPLSMTVPLMILAVLSIGGGWFGHGLSEWLSSSFRIADLRLLGHHEHPWWFLPMALCISAVGIGWATWWYFARTSIAKDLAELFAFVHRVLYEKFYVDELYHCVVIVPFRATANVFHRLFDVVVVDRILILGWGYLARGLSRILRPLQTGDVQQYAVAIAVGLALVLFLVGV